MAVGHNGLKREPLQPGAFQSASEALQGVSLQVTVVACIQVTQWPLRELDYDKRIR